MNKKEFSKKIFGCFLVWFGLWLIVMLSILIVKKSISYYPAEYSYTRIVCSVPEDQSYCQDAIITCKGSKVINIKLLGEPVRMNYTESPLGWCEK